MRDSRLPPGQTLNSGLPTLHHGPVPDFDPSTWDFRIWGAVEIEIVWTWDQILALPRTSLRLDLHCVTGWTKLDTLWEGISLAGLVDEGVVRPLPEAAYVLQHAAFGYTTNLPLSVILQPNFLLATHYAGQPLTPEHGYPLRGVIGSMAGGEQIEDVYLWKGAKWLRGLEFLVEDQLGFWESNGYHNGADVWQEQRRAEDQVS